MVTMEQLKAKLKAVNARSGGGSRARWFPKDKHTVRLLPIEGASEPYKTVYFHYLDKKAFYCPSQNDGEQCDVCDLAASLKEWDDAKPEAERKADFKMGCKLEAVPKYYFPIVERVLSEDKKSTTIQGPYWWSTSEFLWKDLVAIALDDDVIKTHVEDGGDADNGWDPLVNVKLAYDVEVDLQKAGNTDGKGNNKTFNLTKLKEKKKETPLSSDRDEVAKLLAAIPDFSTVETKLNSEEIAKQLELFTNSTAPESKAGSDGTEKTASNNAEKPAAGKKSVDEALEALMNKKV